MYEMINLKTDERIHLSKCREPKYVAFPDTKWVQEKSRIKTYDIRISFRTEERHILELKNSLLEIIKGIQDHFNDYGSRQIGFFDFKDSLMSARKELRENLTLLELIICLFDTVKNLHSENLTRQQLKILKNAVSCISSEVTEVEVEKVTIEFISVGLNPLPSLHGLSEIYREQGEI